LRTLTAVYFTGPRISSSRRSCMPNVRIAAVDVVDPAAPASRCPCERSVSPVRATAPLPCPCMPLFPYPAA
jgi:hypothetical protein